MLELAELLARVAPQVTLVVDGLTAWELPAKLRPLERGHRPRFSDGPGRFFQQDPFKPGVTGAYAEPAIFGEPPPRLLELTGARLVDDPSWRGAGGDIMAFPGGVVVHGSRIAHEFLNHGSGGRGACPIRSSKTALSTPGLVPASTLSPRSGLPSARAHSRRPSPRSWTARI